MTELKHLCISEKLRFRDRFKRDEWTRLLASYTNELEERAEKLLRGVVFVVNGWHTRTHPFLFIGLRNSQDLEMPLLEAKEVIRILCRTLPGSYLKANAEKYEA